MNLRHLLSLGVLALGLAPAGFAARLACDPARSQVEIMVKATVDSFTGHLTHFNPEVTFGPDGTVQAARFRFHFADVETGKDKRDRAMHEWQHTDQFPDGEFVLDALTPEAGGKWQARGRLTLHGHAQPLAFPVTILSQGDLWAIDGEAVIDTRDFELPVIRMMAVLKVDPIVRVRFHLQGRKEAGA